MPVDQLWKFLFWGYLLSVAIETPVLIVGLSRVHSLWRKLVAGLWLTACTYPIVVLVLPILVQDTLGRAAYLTVAEIFAPLAECALFYYAFNRNSDNTHKGAARDYLVIIAANLLSFLPIEVLRAMNWIDW